jgi:hypothetical protein
MNKKRLTICWVTIYFQWGHYIIVNKTGDEQKLKQSINKLAKWLGKYKLLCLIIVWNDAILL